LEGGSCACPRGHRCENAGKHPLIEGWQEAATTDPERVRALWSGRPRANIGMPTGTKSGKDILDVDPRHGGDESLFALVRVHQALPHTVESLTGGGGRQVWFAHREGIRNSAGLLGPGLDVRGEGGLVVLPGSRHVSGRVYEWEASSHPDATPVAVFPEWLALLLVGAGPEERKGPAAAVPEEISEGGRNAMLFSLAGTMRARGMEAAEILPALLAVNQARCRPPLGADEVGEIVAKIGRYRPSRTRTLRLGGEEREVEEDLLLAPLRILRTDHPSYTVTVRGREIELSGADLLSFARFKLRCMEELDFIPALPARFDETGKRQPPGVVWESLVNAALEGAIEDPAPPPDASGPGALWDAVHEFLAGGAKSEDRDALGRGSVVVEDGCYLFRGKDLRRHLTLNSVNGWTPPDLWKVVRARGGDNLLLKVGDRPIRVWRVPEE
jgi:hypothetical protein